MILQSHPNVQGKVEAGFIAINGLSGFIQIDKLSGNDPATWKGLWKFPRWVAPKLGGLLTWNELNNPMVLADDRVWPIRGPQKKLHATYAKTIWDAMKKDAAAGIIPKLFLGEYNEGHVPAWGRTGNVAKWVLKMCKKNFTSKELAAMKKVGTTGAAPDAKVAEHCDSCSQCGLPADVCR